MKALLSWASGAGQGSFGLCLAGYSIVTIAVLGLWITIGHWRARRRR